MAELSVMDIPCDTEIQVGNKTCKWVCTENETEEGSIAEAGTSHEDEVDPVSHEEEKDTASNEEEVDPVSHEEEEDTASNEEETDPTSHVEEEDSENYEEEADLSSYITSLEEGGASQAVICDKVGKKKLSCLNAKNI